MVIFSYFFHQKSGQLNMVSDDVHAKTVQVMMVEAGRRACLDQEGSRFGGSGGSQILGSVCLNGSIWTCASDIADQVQVDPMGKQWVSGGLLRLTLNLLRSTPGQASSGFQRQKLPCGIQ